MLRSFVMEFWAAGNHVGTRSLVSQTADDAVNEARYMLGSAWKTNSKLTHSIVLDVRDDVEEVATINVQEVRR